MPGRTGWTGDYFEEQDSAIIRTDCTRIRSAVDELDGVDEVDEVVEVDELLVDEDEELFPDSILPVISTS